MIYLITEDCLVIFDRGFVPTLSFTFSTSQMSCGFVNAVRSDFTSSGFYALQTVVILS